MPLSVVMNQQKKLLLFFYFPKINFYLLFIFWCSLVGDFPQIREVEMQCSEFTHYAQILCSKVLSEGVLKEEKQLADFLL